MVANREMRELSEEGGTRRQGAKESLSANRTDLRKIPVQIQTQSLKPNVPLPNDVQAYLSAGRFAADNGRYEEAAAKYQ